MIREGRASKNHLQMLGKALKEDADGFVATFVEGGGLQAITMWLSNLSKKTAYELLRTFCCAATILPLLPRVICLSLSL